MINIERRVVRRLDGHDEEDAEKWEFEFTCSSSLADDDDGWTFTPSETTKRREEKRRVAPVRDTESPGLDERQVPGDISGLFSSRLVAPFGIEENHLASLPTSCRRNGRRRRTDVALVLHPFGTRTYVAVLHVRSSSDRKTSPYMAEQYDSFADRASTIPTSSKAYVELAYYV